MTGIILAGGASRRMGQDKALLPWGGGTLLDNATEILSAVVDSIIVVVDDVGKRPALPAEVYVDEFPGAGPLGALITGLGHAGDGYHLVFACDLPLMQPALLLYILHGSYILREPKVELDAVIPVVSGREQVLCAAYQSRARGSLISSFESGERSLRRAIQKLFCARIPEWYLRQLDPDLVSFANVNTRQEYEELWRQYGQP